MATYRGKNVPKWWLDELPEEKNPFQDSDALILDRGCLYYFWHARTSRKHPNNRSVNACNNIRRAIAREFGDAFLNHPNYTEKTETFSPCTSKPLTRAEGRIEQYDGDSLHYRYARMSDDGKSILITNARNYYENVIVFMLECLRVATRYHYPPYDCCHGPAWQLFFPEDVLDTKVLPCVKNEPD